MQRVGFDSHKHHTWALTQSRTGERRENLFGT